MFSMAASSRKWMYVSLVLFAVLIVNGGFLAYAYLNVQSRFSDLQHQFSNLQSQYSNLELQLQGVRQQLQNITAGAFPPLSKIYEMIDESVVLIVTKVQTPNGLTPSAQGSGFVYSKEGYIITNYHVIEGADEIEVIFIDGHVTEARLVGFDPYSDLAVVNVAEPPEQLHPVTLGNSSSLAVGDFIVAVGNPYGLSDTMTAGIVSSLGRELLAPGGYTIIDVIQIDAAINPGNSGGPLVNINGEVVGVNTAIVSESGAFAGIGFAIPSDTVKRELPFLIATGQYKHPWMGISGLDLSLDIAEAMGLEEVKGFLIITVIEGSPAEKAGLRGGTEIVTIGGEQILIGGDVVIGVDDIDVRKLNDLVVYIERNKRPGDTITLTIIRDRQEIGVELTLGERPPP